MAFITECSFSTTVNRPPTFILVFPSKLAALGCLPCNWKGAVKSVVFAILVGRPVDRCWRLAGIRKASGWLVTHRCTPVCCVGCVGRVC